MKKFMAALDSYIEVKIEALDKDLTELKNHPLKRRLLAARDEMSVQLHLAIKEEARNYSGSYDNAI